MKNNIFFFLVTFAAVACSGGSGSDKASDGENSADIALPQSLSIREFETGDTINYTVEQFFPDGQSGYYDLQVTFGKNGFACPESQLIRLSATEKYFSGGELQETLTNDYIVSNDGALYREDSYNCENVEESSVPAFLPSRIVPGSYSTFVADIIDKVEGPLDPLLDALGLGALFPERYVVAEYSMGDIEIIDVNGYNVESVRYGFQETYYRSDNDELLYTLVFEGFIHPDIGIVSGTESFTSASGLVTKIHRDFDGFNYQ